MSSNDLPRPEPAAQAAGYVAGFDETMRGRLAECDGGRSIEGTHFAGRQEFSGRLTGQFRDFGDYPWRWYLMTDLTHKPTGYAQAGVWCAAESLVFEGEQE
jgi:hypothetical protein